MIVAGLPAFNEEVAIGSVVLKARGGTWIRSLL
jgi:hypothetical protein